MAVMGQAEARTLQHRDIYVRRPGAWVFLARFYGEGRRLHAAHVFITEPHDPGECRLHAPHPPQRPRPVQPVP